MSCKKQDAPQGWPEKWQRALEAALANAKSKQIRRQTIYAARRHVSYCKTSGHGFLEFETLIAHREQMWASISYSVANSYASALARIALEGDNATLRDQIREHFIDTRSIEEMATEPYMPHQIRRLALRAVEAGSLTRQHILALDLYARVIDREGALPKDPKRVAEAFWFHPPAKLRQCAILGYAAHALDMLLPGSPDAGLLRITQRSIRQARNPVRKARRDIPADIEKLVESARQKKRGSRGRRYSERTKNAQRQALFIVHDLLAASGQSFRLDREALNMFADHANNQFLAQRAGSGGWSAVYIARTLEKLALFVEDVSLKQDILHDARDYHVEAAKEPKRKERILAEKPVTLPALYLKARDLAAKAENASAKSRSRLSNTAAVLVLLCFYPLRRADVIRLRFGHELHRVLTGWCLTGLPTQKTGMLTEPLRLPPEVTPILDAALLQGDDPDHLWPAYERRTGQCLWSDWKTGQPHSRSLLTQHFQNLVGYSPHLLRTIWADHLVAQGADRLKVSIVLQHKSLISQEEYEVLAAKLRITLAVEKLVEIASEVE
ncbi:hypothetical protein J4729_04920 [Leisingera sp. HS039]|uniref:hypothetical protein n=1 Tax=unclassified Leisingera TaxID=2614906 RepID=UPI00107103D0|nr:MULTISPECIES: hypothetical protein [unclassified Leisingera]MBQ4823891.1 hypothetical protein [Leisingera sp. HS039]QBR35326.1 hypothetical protein ETW23_03370 [Leisingera sp. NJS201]